MTAFALWKPNCPPSIPFLYIRYEIDSVLCAGPPFVNAIIWSNTMSIFFVLKIKFVDTKGISIGSVRSLKVCQRLAPSIIPASYSGSALEGFVIINRHSTVNPPKTDDISVFVRKQWVDDNDRQGIRPKSVTVQLIKDSEVYRTAQLDGSNDWSFRFDKLKDGEYTVKEISPEGYSTSYNRTDGNLYIVINTVGDEKDDPPLKPVNPTPSDTTDIPIEKIWLDNENESGARPESITVRLIKDGGIYREMELTEETDWKGVFSDVPSDASYSITEKEVQDYSAAYSKSDDNGFVITNTFTPGNPSIGVPPQAIRSCLD